MLKGPPSGIPRQLPASQTIGFAVRRDGGEKVEKVEDDFGTSIGVDTDGDEGRERVAGQIRIWVLLSARLPHIPLAWARTLFADFEQLVGLPCNHAAR